MICSWFVCIVCALFVLHVFAWFVCFVVRFVCLLDCCVCVACFVGLASCFVWCVYVWFACLLFVLLVQFFFGPMCVFVVGFALFVPCFDCLLGFVVCRCCFLLCFMPRFI